MTVLPDLKFNTPKVFKQDENVAYDKNKIIADEEWTDALESDVGIYSKRE
jgi:hypothetical protein